MMNNKKEKEFQCLCCQTLSKSVPVFTDEYTLLSSEEVPDIDTSGIAWASVYHDNDHYTPIQLITLFRQCLEENLKNGIVFKTPGVTEHLIEECEGWIEDEIEYVED